MTSLTLIHVRSKWFNSVSFDHAYRRLLYSALELCKAVPYKFIPLWTWITTQWVRTPASKLIGLVKETVLSVVNSQWLKNTKYLQILSSTTRFCLIDRIIHSFILIRLAQYKFAWIIKHNTALHFHDLKLKDGTLSGGILYHGVMYCSNKVRLNKARLC